MKSQFENSERMRFEGNDKFKQSLTEKVRSDIQERMKEKAEQYYRERTDSQQLDDIAERLFTLVRQGVSEEDVQQELNRAASSVIEGRS